MTDRCTEIFKKQDNLTLGSPQRDINASEASERTIQYYENPQWTRAVQEFQRGLYMIQIRQKEIIPMK